MNSVAFSLFPEILGEPLYWHAGTGLICLKTSFPLGHVKGTTPISPDKIQPSSIDFRLGAGRLRV